MESIEDIENMFQHTYGSSHLKFKEQMDPSEAVLNYTDYVIKHILCNYKELTPKKLEQKMTVLCKLYKLERRPKFSVINYIIKQKIDINEITEEQYYILMSFLTSKKMRSLSGILEIAIMMAGSWEGSEEGTTESFSCKYDCYYCPDQPGMPRSYVAEGPSARRALQWNFETVGQFHERASVYAINGHPVDKIEFIALGGTWDSFPIEYQRIFVTKVYYAANTFYNHEPLRDMLSMEEEININETALCKIIGFTIETRPDQISKENILRYLSYGVTRVQMGIQHTQNKILKGINRQCTIEDAYEGIYLLKEAGLKVQTHWMPNLPNSSPEQDKTMFDELNYNPLLQSDDIKIYPTIVTKTSDRDTNVVYTVIEKWFNEGKYVPYSNEELHEVIIYGKTHIQHHVRISRVFRDIPMPNILGGANQPHMRQIIHKKMEERGLKCECIRCCEVKDRIVDPKKIHIKSYSYDASYSSEYFISAESLDENDNRIVHGFVRLRIPHNSKTKWIEDLKDCALIRELHVYGQLVPTFNSSYQHNNQHNNQHKGLGRKLINEAEKISKKEGFKKISITSGVGVRCYYEKLGYYMGDFYMIKDLTEINVDKLVILYLSAYAFIVILCIIINVVLMKYY